MKTPILQTSWQSVYSGTRTRGCVRMRLSSTFGFWKDFLLKFWFTTKRCTELRLLNYPLMYWRLVMISLLKRGMKWSMLKRLRRKNSNSRLKDMQKRHRRNDLWFSKVRRLYSRLLNNNNSYPYKHTKHRQARFRHSREKSRKKWIAVQEILQRIQLKKAQMPQMYIINSLRQIEGCLLKESWKLRKTH